MSFKNPKVEWEKYVNLLSITIANCVRIYVMSLLYLVVEFEEENGKKNEDNLRKSKFINKITINF